MRDLIKVQSIARDLLGVVVGVLEEHNLEARAIRECLKLPHLNGEGFGPKTPPTCNFKWWWQNDRAFTLCVHLTFNNDGFAESGTFPLLSVSVSEPEGGMILNWMYGGYREEQLFLNRQQGRPSITALVDALAPLQCNHSIPPEHHAAAYRAFVRRYLGK